VRTREAVAGCRLPVAGEHREIADRLMLLRCPRVDPKDGFPGLPVPWAEVQANLGLSERELLPYRWLIAAELHAENQGWKSIALHPAVDLRADTLSKNHARARLPGGIRFPEYVQAFREAACRRLRELQEERGAEAAEQLHGIVKRAALNLGRVQDLLDDYFANPMQERMETAEQTIIEFGAKFPGRPAKRRIKPDFALGLLQMQTNLIGAVKLARDVLMLTAVEEGTGQPREDVLPTDEETAKLLARSERLIAEMRGYGATREAASA